MGGLRLSVDLRTLLDQVAMTSFEQKRLYYRDGQVHFADAVRVEDPSRIPVDVEETTIVSSDKPINSLTLVVGLHRDGGFSKPLSGSFNGQPFEVRVEWSKKMNHVFAPARIDLDPASLMKCNEVVIRSIPGLTITSVQLEIDTIDN